TAGGKIATNGWQEESNLELIPFIKNYLKKGIQYVICTDISKDGMLQGPSFKTYNKIINQATVITNDSNISSTVKLIASGGISSYGELPKLVELGCEGVIIGKAIYENKISLKQLEHFILNN
ncbi:1-(5-phosphoribosyl)-5-[(5-phosphoribosylamino)methylideneamino]imidazole-4-carboxamide isomerase, partial [Pontimicrobium sp. MEBiC01747]